MTIFSVFSAIILKVLNPFEIASLAYLLWNTRYGHIYISLLSRYNDKQKSVKTTYDIFWIPSDHSPWLPYEF